MSDLTQYQSLLLSLKPQFNSIEEAKVALQDNLGDYKSFTVFEPGQYRRYRLSRDRAGEIVVNQDNALSVYDLTEARRAAVIELGERDMKENGL